MYTYALFQRRFAAVFMTVCAVMLVCIAALAPAHTRAADSYVGDIAIELASDDANDDGAEYEYRFTLDQDLETGQSLYFGFSSLAGTTSSTPLAFLENDGSLVSASFDPGSTPATIQRWSGSESVVQLTATGTLSAGVPYTFIVSDGVNPSAGCYRVGVTSDVAATALSSFTATDRNFTIGGLRLCEPGGMADVEVTAKSYGTVVRLTWKPLKTAIFGETVTSNTYSLVYADSDSELQEKLAAVRRGNAESIELSGYTKKTLTITGLPAKKRQHFAILAYYNDQLIGYTQTSASVKTSTAITVKKFGKPSFSKNAQDVKNNGLKATWKKPAVQPASYSVEIRTQKGRLVSRKSNVSAKATSKTFTKLKSGTKYKIRARAKYTNVYNVETNSFGTVQTKWSSYSKVAVTK